ncbi:MAG: hypothetical protein ABMA02_18045, partial [Saprospiraceae bacterium]
MEDIPLQPASQRRTKIDCNNLEGGTYKEFIDRTVDERLCGFWVSLKKLGQELWLDVKIKHKKERSDWNDPMWSK